MPSGGALLVQRDGDGGDNTVQGVLPQKRLLDHFYSTPAEDGGEGKEEETETAKTLPPAVDGDKKTSSGGDDVEKWALTKKQSLSQPKITPASSNSSTNLPHNDPPLTSPDSATSTSRSA